MGMGMFNGAYAMSASAQRAAVVEAAHAEGRWRVGKAALDILVQEQLSMYQIDLANWQIDMANDIQTHWEQFLPYERQILAYAFAQPEAMANYDAIMQQFANVVEDSFGANYDDYLQWMQTNCMVPTACQDAQWQNEASLAAADYASYAARTEEQRVEALNDIRYAMQKAVLGLGKGVALSMVSFSQAAGQMSNGMGALTGLVNFGMKQFNVGRPMTLPNQQPGIAPLPHDVNIPPMQQKQSGHYVNTQALPPKQQGAMSNFP